MFESDLFIVFFFFRGLGVLGILRLLHIEIYFCYGLFRRGRRCGWWWKGAGVRGYYGSLLDVFSFLSGLSQLGIMKCQCLIVCGSAFGDCQDGSGNGGAARETVSTGSGRTLNCGTKEKRLDFPLQTRKPSPSNVSGLLLLLLPARDTWRRVEEVKEVFGERGLLTCVPETF